MGMTYTSPQSVLRSDLTWLEKEKLSPKAKVFYKQILHAATDNAIIFGYYTDEMAAFDTTHTQAPLLVRELESRGLIHVQDETKTLGFVRITFLKPSKAKEVQEIEDPTLGYTYKEAMDTWIERAGFRAESYKNDGWYMRNGVKVIDLLYSGGVVIPNLTIRQFDLNPAAKLVLGQVIRIQEVDCRAPTTSEVARLVGITQTECDKAFMELFGSITPTEHAE